jgi:uncharacterized protein YggE
MESSVKITLIIVSAVILLALIGVAVYLQGRAGNTMDVQGIAQIKAVPDLVSVYFSVDTNASTAKEAKDKNAEIVDAMTTALVKEGLERKDIVTENFNVYPEYTWENNRQEFKGYRAVHNIKVQLSTDKTDKIGEVIDAGVDSGAGISYINFELSQEKQNEYKAEALKQATEDARIKAESIAEGLGKRVGRVVSVSSSEFDYYPWPIYEYAGGGVAEAKAATTNIQPGEQDITGRVSVVFKIV